MADTLNFRKQLADSLRSYFGMTGEQLSAYETALRHTSSPADTSKRYARDEEIAEVRKRKERFEQEVSSIMDDDQFELWRRKWEPNSNKTVASMLFPYYLNTKRHFFLERKWDILQERLLKAQEDYALILGDILKVDSLTATDLFVEEFLLNEYLLNRDVYLWGIPQQQGLKLAMCIYQHEARKREINQRNVSEFMKTLLGQHEQEAYWQSIIDSLGYDFYCDWYDYQQLGNRFSGKHFIPDDKMDDFRKIRKQFDTERVKILRGMPELSGDQKQLLIEAVGKIHDDAVERLMNRK